MANGLGGTMKKKEIKGLGDVVEIITVTLGVKKLVTNCNDCKKRREKWNEKIPFKKNVPSNEDAIRVVEEQVKEVLTSYKKSNGST